jgi:hypothetical protein
LVELPLGSTLEKFIFEIGEGTGTNKRIKAVQTGAHQEAVFRWNISVRPSIMNLYRVWVLSWVPVEWWLWIRIIAWWMWQIFFRI